MQRFEGKVAVITGGGAGIGRATARRIAAEGGRVALLDTSAEDVERAVAGLEREGVTCLGVHGDVASPADCEAVVQRAWDAWGRLDVLVANAAARAYGSVLEAPEADWQRLLAVNLRGTVNSCTAAARAMRRAIAAGQQQGGAMVLVSSVCAVVGRADMPIYDATKAAILSLTRSLAVDLAGDGIRVNSLCPGFVVTDFHIRRAVADGQTIEDLRARRPGLLERPGEPEEIAAAIAFLASSDASYITATNLMVDAGGSAV